MTLRRIVFAGVVLGLVLMSSIALLLMRADPAQVPVHEVRRGDFVRRVVAEGNLEAVRATPIVVPSAIRGEFQIAWLAEEGRRVEAGDVVLRLDPSELERTLIDAREKRRGAELRMALERVSGEATARNLARDAELAELELANARAFQKRDDLIYSRFEIVESEIDQSLAESRQEHAADTERSRRSLVRTELDLLDLERRQAAAEIERTERVLGALEVRAPHAGLLILERDWREQPPRVGETVYTAQKLAEIPDLSEMKAEVYVLEADAGGLEAGQTAVVVVESRPGEVYPAVVGRVDSLARQRIQASPVQYFGATLRFDRTPPELMKPGQRVRAEIVVERLENVLAVPRQAVFERDGRWFTHLLRRGGFEATEVRVGAAGAGRVVVTGGLSEGDQIAAHDPGWTPGSTSGPDAGLGESAPALPAGADEDGR